MSYAIVYTSLTGNTARLAEALRAALPAEDCLYFGAPTRPPWPPIPSTPVSGPTKGPVISRWKIFCAP